MTAAIPDRRREWWSTTRTRIVCATAMFLSSSASIALEPIPRTRFRVPRVRGLRRDGEIAFRAHLLAGTQDFRIVASAIISHTDGAVAACRSALNSVTYCRKVAPLFHAQHGLRAANRVSSMTSQWPGECVIGGMPEQNGVAQSDEGRLKIKLSSAQPRQPAKSKQEIHP